MGLRGSNDNVLALELDAIKDTDFYVYHNSEVDIGGH